MAGDLSIRQKLSQAIDDFPIINDNPADLFVEALEEIDRLKLSNRNLRDKLKRYEDEEDFFSGTSCN